MLPHSRVLRFRYPSIRRGQRITVWGKGHRMQHSPRVGVSFSPRPWSVTIVEGILVSSTMLTGERRHERKLATYHRRGQKSA